MKTKCLVQVLEIVREENKNIEICPVVTTLNDGHSCSVQSVNGCKFKRKHRYNLQNNKKKVTGSHMLENFYSIY